MGSMLASESMLRAELILVCAGLLISSVFHSGAMPGVDAAGARTRPAIAVQDDELQARTTCAPCHAFPPPEILPKSAWRDEFVRMHFIRENRMPPVGPPGTLARVQ